MGRSRPTPITPPPPPSPPPVPPVAQAIDVTGQVEALRNKRKLRQNRASTILSRPSKGYTLGGDMGGDKPTLG